MRLGPRLSGTTLSRVIFVKPGVSYGRVGLGNESNGARRRARTVVALFRLLVSEVDLSSVAAG